MGISATIPELPEDERLESRHVRPWMNVRDRCRNREAKELLSLELQEPRDRFLLRVSKNQLPDDDVLFRTVVTYGRELSQVFREWLILTGQECDEEFIAAVEADLRNDLGKIFWSLMRRVPADKTERYDKYFGSLVVAIGAARTACIRALQIHRGEQSLATGRSIKQKSSPKPKAPFGKATLRIMRRLGLIGAQRLCKELTRLDEPPPLDPEWRKEDGGIPKDWSDAYTDRELRQKIRSRRSHVVERYYKDRVPGRGV